MHLKQAIIKYRQQIVVGWTLSVISLIMLIMSCILTLYYMTLGSNVFDKPFNQIALIIYNNTQFFGLEYLWKIVPVVHYPEIFTIKNLGFAAIICLFILGVTVRDSGINLAKRLNRIKNEAEEELWLRSLKEDQFAQDSFQPIVIQIENKDNWYTRPFGIISLSVIAGYLVVLLSKISGL